MDSSGTIYRLDGAPVPDEDLRRAGLVPVKEEALEEVLKMNRRGRRAWFAEQRKVHKQKLARDRAKEKRT